VHPYGRGGFLKLPIQMGGGQIKKHPFAFSECFIGTDMVGGVFQESTIAKIEIFLFKGGPVPLEQIQRDLEFEM